jgi:hypothetical protein
MYRLNLGGCPVAGRASALRIFSALPRAAWSGLGNTFATGHNTCAALGSKHRMLGQPRGFRTPQMIRGRHSTYSIEATSRGSQFGTFHISAAVKPSPPSTTTRLGQVASKQAARDEYDKNIPR